MGFWNTVSKVGGAILDSVQRQAEQRQREMDRAEEKASRIEDDRELVKKFQNSSGFDKYGYAKELEYRGYLEKGSDGKYKRTNKTL